jgi:hypothetical protein
MIRVPWVAVVGGGMDTSTMAIGGRDSEVFTGRGSTCWCRITRVSLIRATRTAPCVAVVDRHRRETAGPGARVYQSAKTVRTHQRMLGADGPRDVVQRARELRIV